MKKTLTTIIFSLAVCLVYAQSSTILSFDMAEAAGTDKAPTTLPVTNRTIKTIILENAFPNRSYVINISTTPRIEPPLSVSGAVAGGGPCTNLEAAYNTAYTFATVEVATKTEKELRDKLKAMNDLAISTPCVGDNALLAKIKALNENCTRIIQLPVAVDFKNNNDYNLSIAAGNKTYYYKFAGKAKGRWLSNYGFLFTPRSIEPERYFQEQIGKDSFQIKKKTDASILDLRFAPTIFFSYFFDKNVDKNWNSSLSLGLGFNFQSPVISFGYNGMYNQNIGFSAGIVFYEHQNLDGRYREGKILKENLPEGKLYESQFFRPNLFIALNVRLGENPFKTEKKTAE